ncbi:trigger factor [Polluticoccus soli]|uniref:trigger factor n=1 Tax=Polluticoccus soli TaxID=3034150 RepID=UPI0023E1B6D4|nr:trigger factor [Flavipsychrobacter sp. JY13-12]
MATVTRENIGNLHEKITVKLAKEDYLPSFEKSLKQYAKTANVPGFRKGMVPAGMVKKMYGQSIFSDEVLRTAGSKLEDYLKNEKVAIFAQPMVMPSETPIRLDMNAPSDVDFTFEIGLKPDFEIAPLKGKPALTKYKVAVSDKMLEDEIERVKRRYGKAEDQESVTNKDNIIYCKYEACDADGNVLPEANMVEDTALLEKYPAKLQDMLMGKKAEDTLVIQPASVCTEEELAGFMKDPLKQGVEAANNYYKLTLTKVAQLIPAELGEALYSQLFPNDEIKDEAAFKERIRTELSREYDRISNERLHNEIYELLVHQTPLQLPVDFLKRWMREGGDKPKSEADVEKEFGGFDHQLRWTLISDKLIQDNDINVTREEVLEDLKGRVLAYFGMSVEDAADAPWLDGYMQKVLKDDKTMDETYRRILFDRLFKHLEGQFSLAEQEISEEEFFKLPDAHAAHHHHH